MRNFIILSIETHLFFARIMREHALFLAAGFPSMEKERIRQADFFREQFEKLLCEVTDLACGRVRPCVLGSGEIVTEFTIPAEQKTSLLTGIPIDSSISEKELSLSTNVQKMDAKELFQIICSINERALELLKGLIEFKESILKDVDCCTLFTTNYPLLIKHILREAKLYCSLIESLMNGRGISPRRLCETERFWNQIMMEHALFIRGLLDPSEEELIHTADDFAGDYKRLLQTAKQQDCRAIRQASLTKTLEYRDFKAAGADGVLKCNISSIILPLLADHVLREANHYLRLMRADR